VKLKGPARSIGKTLPREIPYPSLLEALEFQAVEIEKGSAVFYFTRREWHYNSIGSGLLKATGKVIHQGGRTALTEAQLTDKNGAIYAHGVSTCMILK
jgi:hypothetical protein